MCYDVQALLGLSCQITGDVFCIMQSDFIKRFYSTYSYLLDNYIF